MTTTTERAPAGRVRGYLLALSAVLVTVPVVGSQAQSLSCGLDGRINRIGPLWEEIKAPAFPVGPAAITAYAVTPQRPDVVFFTNGLSVVRSDDGGCHTEPVLALDQIGGTLGLSSLTTRITGITVAEKRGSSKHVVLTAVEVEGGVGRPHVIRSDDEGQTGSWTLADSGLPAVGRPGDLRFAPNDGRVAYLSLRGVPAVPAPVPVPGVPTESGALFRSADGGATWAAASDVTDFAGAAAIEDFAVAQASADHLWVIAGGRLRRSTDGGRTYSDAGLPLSVQQSNNYRFTAVDVSGSRVVAFSASSQTGARALVSTDGGASYTDRPAPPDVRSVAHTKDPATVWIGTVSGSADVYKYAVKTGQYAKLTPASSTADFAITADRIYDETYAVTGTALYRARPPQAGKRPVPLEVPDFDGVKPPAPARLSPQTTTLRLEIGQTKTVEYTVEVPRRPTPLDVFLLIDNSQSMASTIAGVKDDLADVIRSLNKNGIDVWAGAGLYQTTEDPPLYLKVAEVAKPGPKLYQGLDLLKADSGGQHEPTLIALDQVATGSGLSKSDFPFLSPCDLGNVGVANQPELDKFIEDNNPCVIKKGQHARFRTGTLRVILHATDEKFEAELKGIDPSKQPTKVEVAQHLNERRIQHVGIYRNASKADLEEMSELTGTFAPPGGVDCNQDGQVDVKAGDPIICLTSPELGATLVEVLNALRDEQPMDFFPVQASPVVGRIAPNRLNAVNVKADNVLHFRTTFTCVNVAPGTYDVKLAAALRGAQIATALAQVVCGAPPNRPPGEAPNPPGSRQQPLQNPPQPAPVLPVVQVQPQVQPQSQPQPQANPQAGSATEEEEEFQLAVATVEAARDDGNVQLAMVGLGVSAALTAAAGSAMGRRSRDRARTGLATVRSGRRR